MSPSRDACSHFLHVAVLLPWYGEDMQVRLGQDARLNIPTGMPRFRHEGEQALRRWNTHTLRSSLWPFALTGLNQWRACACGTGKSAHSCTHNHQPLKPRIQHSPFRCSNSKSQRHGDAVQAVSVVPMHHSCCNGSAATSAAAVHATPQVTPRPRPHRCRVTARRAQLWHRSRCTPNATIISGTPMSIAASACSA